MFFLRDNPWVGVDLGSAAVKMAQVARRGKAWSLVDSSIILRREPSETEHVGAARFPSSADELSAARSLADRITARRAAGVLSMAVCETHSMRLEKQGETATGEMARQLATAGIGGSDWLFDYWSTAHPTDHPQRPPDNTSVVCVDQEHAAAAVKDLSKAGLRCETLDAAPLALARCVQLAAGRREGEPIAAIDWGYSRVTFCAIRDGRPLYVRGLKQCGFTHILRAVKDRLQCTTEEALELLQQPATGSQQESALSAVFAETVEPELRKLESELDRTIQFLQTHRRNASPTGLFLFGAGAMLAGAAQALSKSLEIPVEPWRPAADKLECSPQQRHCLPLLASAIAASALAWEDKS